MHHPQNRKYSETNKNNPLKIKIGNSLKNKTFRFKNVTKCSMKEIVLK
jgi:hypothetical protein